MPTKSSDLTDAALKSALSEIMNGPLFSQSPNAALTLDTLLKFQQVMKDVAKSVPALQDYSQNLDLALNLTKANKETISKWASASQQQCAATQITAASSRNSAVPVVPKAGTVTDVQAISGPAMLQQSALDAVKSWGYRPLLVKGDPVAFRTTVDIAYGTGNPPR
jgi:hypothetical protein